MQAVCKLFKAGLFEMCLLSRQYQESRPRRQELLLAEGVYFFSFAKYGLYVVLFVLTFHRFPLFGPLP